MPVSNLRAALTAALALVGAPALAVPFSVNLDAGTDDAGGRSFDAELSVSPNGHLQLRAGAGHSTAGDDAGGLAGTLLDAGATLRGGRGGFALDYDRFDDSSNYRTATVAARAFLSFGDFEVALLGRHRDTSVTLSLGLPNRTLTRAVDFSALGGGAQFTWSGETASAYLLGITYDYDSKFDDFVALADSPLLARRPLIEALVGTFLTQAQGAIDRQLGAGIERSFGRNSLALDAAYVHDAMLDSGSTSLALTWNRAQSARFDWSLTGGIADSERYGSIAFVSVGAGISN